MHDFHSHLNISIEEWNAFLEDFQQSLDKFNVPQAEQKKLFEIVESTRKDIVNSMQ
jgi:hemoglobin